MNCCKIPLHSFIPQILPPAHNVPETVEGTKYKGEKRDIVSSFTRNRNYNLVEEIDTSHKQTSKYTIAKYYKCSTGDKEYLELKMKWRRHAYSNQGRPVFLV